METTASVQFVVLTRDEARRSFAKAAAFMAALMAALVLGLTVAPAQAHAADAINKTLLSYSNWEDSSVKTKTVTKYDITGDKKADTIKIKAGNGKVRIYVNGTLCGTVSCDYAYDYTVKYVRTSTKHPFLYVTATGDNDDGSFVLYQYKSSTGKFTRITTQSFMPSKYGYHLGIDKVWASGKYIKVRYRIMSYTAGNVTATYTFKWSSGTLKRSSSSTSTVGYYNGETGSSNTWITLYKKVTLYKTAGGSTKVTTAAKGTSVKIVGVKVSNKKLYFKLKTKSGKVGWIKGLSESYDYSSYSEGGTLFEECYLAG